jgi:small conductance mechanosensitive channel
MFDDIEIIREAKRALVAALPSVALALLLLIVGWMVINKFNSWLKHFMVARSVEVSLVPFLSSLVNIGLKILLLVTVASVLGIETTSFVTILGAAGLAIGLALQGSLSNFAGGVLILLFKPFKVGDLIESDGEIGEVKSITVLYTILSTPADNTAIIPNGQVANSKVINYTKENNRRVDLTIGIGYDEDIVKAKKVLQEAMVNIPKVLKEPAPFVGVIGFGDSSVNLAVRPFAQSKDYWEVYFAANEAIKNALDDHNIEIPYPHQVEISKSI